MRTSSEASAGPNDEMWRTAMTERQKASGHRGFWAPPQGGAVTSTFLTLHH